MDARWYIAIASIALAGSPPARADESDRTLTARDVQKYFEPYVPEVRGCYLAQARGKTATGELRLELIIHRDGSVFHFGFAASGVDERSRARLETCLRSHVPKWKFPVRRGFTSAVLPFLFHKARAPGSGPYESCWDTRGCPPGTAKGTK